MKKMEIQREGEESRAGAMRSKINMVLLGGFCFGFSAFVSHIIPFIFFFFSFFFFLAILG